MLSVISTAISVDQKGEKYLQFNFGIACFILYLKQQQKKKRFQLRKSKK